MPAVPTGWEILGATLEAQPRGAPATTHAQFVQLLAPCFTQRQQVRFCGWRPLFAALRLLLLCML